MTSASAHGDRFTGRSGRVWEHRVVQLRPGHLRAAGAAALRATRLVKEEENEVYGALRVFSSRQQRSRAAAFLAAGSPVTSALLDVVDQSGFPPALVTSWAPGDSSTSLHALRERDDLDTMLANGHRWTPAGALRTLVPLGRALDDLASAGFTPIELSPDHLVVNSGSIVLVGLGRHGYIPVEGVMPGAHGMSLPSALLLGDDLPPARSGSEVATSWREVQLRALMRLAGWMVSGLAPASWGTVRGTSDLPRYLEAAGFLNVPVLRPRHLAADLAREARREEQSRARADFTAAKALLLYDDSAQHRGSGVTINPEALRLGLLRDQGPDVIAIAAFEAHRFGTRLATLLSGAGWILVPNRELRAHARRAAAAAPEGRIIVAGRMQDGDLVALKREAGGRVEQVDPEDLSTAAPRIAGRPADQLPYVTDPELDEYFKEILDGSGGQARRRRTFAGGWTLKLGDGERMSVRDRTQLLERMADCFGNNTELLVAVRMHQNAPGMRKQTKLLDEASMRKVVTALSGVPFSVFRQCLMAALLGPSEEHLFGEATRRLLPVAACLSRVFDPHTAIGPDAQTMDDALRRRRGIRRVGLFGRLCTAVPGMAPAQLAASVSRMDDELVTLLSEIPAPSLHFLAGRFEDPDLLAFLRPHMNSEDLDLLSRYTPRMWRTLLDGLRQPESLNTLGLGWVQIVAQDHANTVDAQVLTRIAVDAGVEGPELVRAVLGTPVAHWPLICRHPGFAARWLSEQRDLDFGDIIAGFDQPETALAELGTNGLRLAHELGLGQEAMCNLKDYADGIERPLNDVLDAFQRRGYENASQTEPLRPKAAVVWSRWRLGRGRPLDWVIGSVVEKPERIRDWAINGPRLPHRVCEEVMAAGLPDPAASLATLTRAPALLPILAALHSPEQREALLALHAAEPAGALDPKVRSELPLILACDDPLRALRTMLREGLGVVAQDFAERAALGPEQRRVLAELAPLTSKLASRSLEAVLTVAARFGKKAAVTAAVVEQHLPGAAEAAMSWGPRWLPLLAGPSGARILDVLVEHREKHAARAGRLTPWLLAAGEDGLAFVERFGPDALDVVLATGAAPTEARFLAELMTLPGSSSCLYELITKLRLPHDSWGRAARLIARRIPSDEIALRMWSSVVFADEE